MKTFITFEGMSCEHCVKAVTEAVTALPGVGSATVDLKGGMVTVEHDPGLTDVLRIKTEIEELGYDVIE